MKKTRLWNKGLRSVAVAAVLVAPGLAAAVTTGDIAKDPKKFEGSEVTVRADVDKVFDRRYFTLDEDAAFAGPDVLVLAPDASRVLDEDEEVVVTGTVRAFVRADIERDYTWFKPEDDVVVTLKARPVIVASSVVAKDGRELLTRQPAPQAPAAAPPSVVVPPEIGKGQKMPEGTERTIGQSGSAPAPGTTDR